MGAFGERIPSKMNEIMFLMCRYRVSKLYDYRKRERSPMTPGEFRRHVNVQSMMLDSSPGALFGPHPTVPCGLWPLGGPLRWALSLSYTQTDHGECRCARCQGFNDPVAASGSLFPGANAQEVREETTARSQKIVFLRKVHTTLMQERGLEGHR